MKEIRFERTVEAFGRNGFTKNIGLFLSAYDDSLIALRYLNSRGNVGRAMIEVPMENVPELIEALEELVEEERPDLYAKYLAGF